MKPQKSRRDKNRANRGLTRSSILEALEFFRARPNSVDAVITDLTMPNLTRVEFAQRIRRIRSNICIISCTGFGDAFTEDRIRALGISELVMKPILRRDIAEAIRRVLNQ